MDGKTLRVDGHRLKSPKTIGFQPAWFEHRRGAQVLVHDLPVLGNLLQRSQLYLPAMNIRLITNVALLDADGKNETEQAEVSTR